MFGCSSDIKNGLFVSNRVRISLLVLLVTSNERSNEIYVFMIDVQLWLDTKHQNKHTIRSAIIDLTQSDAFKRIIGDIGDANAILDLQNRQMPFVHDIKN